MQQQPQSKLDHARAAGFTKDVIAEAGMTELELAIRPDTDLDGRFTAFDRDMQQYVTVNGWMCLIEDDEPTTVPAELGRAN